METGIKSQLTTEATVRQAQVLRLQPEPGKTVCILSGADPVLVSESLGARIRPGDQIGFVMETDSADASGEIYIRRATPSARNQDIYQARISCAGQAQTRQSWPTVCARRSDAGTVRHLGCASALRCAPRLLLRHRPPSNLGSASAPIRNSANVSERVTGRTAPGF